MKTFTEEWRTKDGDELIIYFGVHDEKDECYTNVSMSENGFCFFDKRLHGIYTSTDELTEYAVKFMFNALLAWDAGCMTEELVDYKFID